MPDPVTLDLQLRPNIRWQNRAPLNGRVLTAEDVRFSLQRQMESRSAGLVQDIESVTALDSRTVRITLSTPGVEILEKLAHGGSSIVPRELDEDLDLFGDVKSVGSGPWIITSGNNSFTVAERNSDYYIPNLPYVDNLQIEFITDSFTRASTVRNGVRQATLTTAYEAFLAEYTFGQGRLRVTNPLEVKTIRSLDLGLELALNTKVAPLDNVLVREAIFLAIDPDQMAAEVCRAAIPQSRSTPPMAEQAAIAFATDKACERNLPAQSLNLAPPEPSWNTPDLLTSNVFANRDRALTLLAEGAFSQSAPIVIKTAEYGDEYIYYGEAIAEALQRVGIAASVTRVTTRTFAEDVWQGGNYDMFVGASAPIAGLTARLLSGYHSQGQVNTTGYSTPQLDQLIESLAVEPNPTVRRSQFQEIEQLILEGRHRVNLRNLELFWLINSCVRNFYPDIFYGNPYFTEEVWVDGCG